MQALEFEDSAAAPAEPLGAPVRAILPLLPIPCTRRDVVTATDCGNAEQPCRR